MTPPNGPEGLEDTFSPSRHDWRERGIRRLQPSGHVRDRTGVLGPEHGLSASSSRQGRKAAPEWSRTTGRPAPDGTPHGTPRGYGAVGRSVAPEPGPGVRNAEGVTVTEGRTDKRDADGVHPDVRLSPCYIPHLHLPRTHPGVRRYRDEERPGVTGDS